MFDNLCKSWPRESQQCINRLKNKQTSYRVLNTVLIKVLYERCGSWPQKCYGDGYSTGWLRHFIATRRYEFFNFRSAEARSIWKRTFDVGSLLQSLLVPMTVFQNCNLGELQKLAEYLNITELKEALWDIEHNSGCAFDSFQDDKREWLPMINITWCWGIF